jgi:hypothetical protein
MVMGMEWKSGGCGKEQNRYLSSDFHYRFVKFVSPKENFREEELYGSGATSIPSIALNKHLKKNCQRSNPSGIYFTKPI